MEKEKIRTAKTYDELLDIKYGKPGEKKRDEFEIKAQYFVISEMLKSARDEAHLTQEQLALKTGIKRSYISKIENGNCDVPISKLYRLFEDGFGKRISMIFL